MTAEFAQLAARLGLQEAAPLLPGAGQQSAHNQRPLELFFPFDPYLLPGSSHPLDLPQTYICWHAGHPRTLREPAPSCALDGEIGSDASSDDEIRHPQDSGALGGFKPLGAHSWVLRCLAVLSERCMPCRIYCILYL